MPAGSHGFPVGSICCTVLSDGYASYPAEWFFPTAEPARLHEALKQRGLPGDSVLSPYACLLIETGRHVLLIDSGGGMASKTTGAIRARLEMAGIRPRDVGTVVLSHAHPDHVGGLVDERGRPAFPSARHILMEAEWDFWMRSRSDLSGLRLPPQYVDSMRTAARRSLHAVRHHVEPVTKETEIVPGVRLLPAPGHTPGHLAILIASEGECLLNFADAAVHPLHLEQPEWENGFDADPGLAGNTRAELTERAGSEGMHVMGFHFPFPSVGRLERRAEGGWRWIPGW